MEKRRASAQRLLCSQCVDWRPPRALMRFAADLLFIPNPRRLVKIDRRAVVLVVLDQSKNHKKLSGNASSIIAEKFLAFRNHWCARPCHPISNKSAACT